MGVDHFLAFPFPVQTHRVAPNGTNKMITDRAVVNSSQALRAWQGGSGTIAHVMKPGEGRTCVRLMDGASLGVYLPPGELH